MGRRRPGAGGWAARGGCSPALLDKFRSGDMDWRGQKTHFGLVLSGEKLDSDLAFRTKLLELEEET